MAETPDLYGELVVLDSTLFQAIVANDSVDNKATRWRRGEGKFLDDTSTLDLAWGMFQKCGGDKTAQDYCLRQILATFARFSFWGTEVRDAIRQELLDALKERLAASAPEAIERLDVLTMQTAHAVRAVTKGSE